MRVPNSTKRRAVLLTAAGLIAAGGGLATLTKPARAAVDPEFSVPDTEFTSPDGQPSQVWVYATGEWSYTVDTAVGEVAAALYLLDTGDRFHLLDVAETATTATQNSGTFDLGGDILDTDAYTPSDFDAPGAGKSKTITVEVGVLLRVLDPAGQLITDGRATTLADIMVTENALKAAIGGSGAVAFADDQTATSPTPP